MILDLLTTFTSTSRNENGEKRSYQIVKAIKKRTGVTVRLLHPGILSYVFTRDLRVSTWLQNKFHCDFVTIVFA